MKHGRGVTAIVFTLAVASATACGTAAPTGGKSGGHPADLTMVAYGGTSQANESSVFATPFARAHQLSILEDTTDYGKFYAMEQAHHVTWDLMNEDGWFAMKACAAGYATPIDKTVVPVQLLPSQDVSKCGIAPWSLSQVLAWNSDKVHTRDLTWKEFFDVKDYPGMRGIWNDPSSGALEAALSGDGVPASQIYPLDLSRALKKLGSIRSSLVITDSLQQLVQQLATGQTVMAVASLPRVVAFAKQGYPIKWTFQNQILAGDYWMVPRDAPNAKAAMQLLGTMLNTPELVEFATVNTYGPNTTTARQALSSSPGCTYIDTCPENLKDPIYRSDQWWLTNNQQATNQWQSFVGA